MGCQIFRPVFFAVFFAVYSALISAALTYLRLRFSWRGVDVPCDRSLHSRPTPHGGGVGVVCGALVCGGIAGVEAHWLLPMIMLAFVSWVDDWMELRVWTRLSVHLIAATWLVFVSEDVATPYAILSVIAIVWVTNAYNFMDGADGLAGSMSVIGFSVYAIAFIQAGLDSLAALSAGLAGGALAFLWFNWHPARIFMGDVGAIPLGFLAGGLGWYGAVAGAWPGWFGPMVFAPFLLDATMTLLRRLIRRELVWRPHREHYYQRMVLAGMSHNAMCLRWLIVMVSGGGAALFFLRLPGVYPWIGVALWCSVLGLFGWRIDEKWGRYRRVDLQ